MEVTYLVVSIVNQKGGVGKTTTAVNLSAALAMQGKSVLLFDIDAQGNATTGLGVSKKGVKLTAYDVFIGTADAKKAVIHTEKCGVDLIPASIDLAGVDTELAFAQNRSYLLKAALEDIRKEYDYIIIDSPPSLGSLTVNVLAASDKVIVPMQCEFYSMEGLVQLQETIKQVKNRFNSSLETLGILFTMNPMFSKASTLVMKEIKSHFGELVFNTVIPRSNKLNQSPSFGEPIFTYAKGSKGAKAYTALALEVISRTEKGNKTDV